MVTTIYAITREVDDYDSYPCPIGYVTDESLANELVFKFTEFNKIAQLLTNKFYEILESVELEEPTSKIIPITKWKSGIAQDDITLEMRSERDRILKHNSDMREEWSAYREKKSLIGKELVNEYIETLHSEYDEDFMKYLRENICNYYQVNRWIYTWRKIDKI